MFNFDFNSKRVKNKDVSIFKERTSLVFLLVVVLLCIVFLFTELNNGRFWTNDFKVYFEATRDFFAGNSPYVHNYGLGSGFFKYTPFSLYLFSPQLLVSYTIGQLIHFVLSVVALLFSLFILRQLTEKYFNQKFSGVSAGFMFLLFACVAIQITRELHLGNINLILLSLFLFGIKCLVEDKALLQSLSWSLLILLKPYMIFVVIPLLIMKQWKVIIMTGTVCLLFIFSPILHLGFNAAFQLWIDWFGVAVKHTQVITSFNTIKSIVLTYTGSHSGSFFALASLLGLIGFSVFDSYKNKTNTTEFIFIWGAAFISFIPSFFLTDTEHFLLSMPLIWIIIAQLVALNKWYYWCFFGVGMLLFSFHSTDLLGNLSDFAFNFGLMGIGNLVFINLFIVARLTHSKKSVVTKDFETVN